MNSPALHPSRNPIHLEKTRENASIVVDRFLLGCVLVWLILYSTAGCRLSKSEIEELPKPVGGTIERTTEKGPVSMTTRVSPSEPRLSDVVELEIQVTSKDHILVEPPAFAQAVGDFLVLDYSERNVDMFGRSLAPHTRSFRYRLEPVHSGTHLLRSLSIEFTDNRPDSENSGQKSRIESEPIEVKITSEFGNETPDLANLEPMLPPKQIDQNWSWIWIIPVAILVSFFVLLIWATRGKPGSVPVEPKKSPEEIAHAQLDQLLAEELPSKGLFKDFYLRLTGIVRQYIEGSTGIHAPEQTTEEFLRDMRRTQFFPKEQSVRLQDFLEAADMVKYAGQKPEHNQIDDSIERAREFIRLRMSDLASNAGEGK